MNTPPQEEEEKSGNILNGSTNKNKNNTNINSMTKSQNIPNKMDTNILSAITPKLANTTKIIDTKAWDKLFMQQQLK